MVCSELLTRQEITIIDKLQLLLLLDTPRKNIVLNSCGNCLSRTGQPGPERLEEESAVGMLESIIFCISSENN